MNHNVLGEMIFTHYWEREYNIKLFGDVKKTKLVVAGSNEEEFEELQIQAFTEFENIKYSIERSVLISILDYYKSIVFDLRSQYTSIQEADINVPVVEDISGLEKLIEIESVYINYQFNPGAHIVALLFKCKWDISHGVAVIIRNGAVVEVGTQDIAL